MKKTLAILSTAALLASCGVNEVKARRVLEGQGMTSVVIGGYSIFGCAQEDTFKSSFTAKDAKGNPVSGVVCSGILKGFTIRYD